MIVVIKITINMTKSITASSFRSNSITWIKNPSRVIVKHSKPGLVTVRNELKHTHYERQEEHMRTFMSHFESVKMNLACWERRAGHRGAADSSAKDWAHGAVRCSTRHAGGGVTLLEQREVMLARRYHDNYKDLFPVYDRGMGLPAFGFYLVSWCPRICAWLGFVLLSRKACPPPSACFSWGAVTGSWRNTSTNWSHSL